MKLQFQGDADGRSLTAADLKALGVDHDKKLDVRKGEVFEVGEEAGQALLSHPSLAGEFKELKDPEPESAGGAAGAGDTGSSSETGGTEVTSDTSASGGASSSSSSSGASGSTAKASRKASR